MKNLLLEIFSEEIPAGYIEPALNALAEKLSKKLDESRIKYGNIKTFGTPRRLGILIDSVSEMQETVTTEIIGPPEKASFDDDGKPKIAAQKFAEKAEITIDQIKIKDTPKGRYLSAEVTEKGISTKNILENILPDIILSIPFPKTMKWSDLSIFFARPIRNIMAIFGNDYVPFILGNIKSGAITYGHRFMFPKSIEINDTKEYQDKLRSAYVIADIVERKNEIRQKIEKAAKDSGGEVLKDDELVDIVTNLVEYPAISVGKFDTKFLSLPKEILITAMREHQKYFAVIDDKQKLMPYFIAVNNTPVKDMSLVSMGHARVLRARLEDASFFYKADKKDIFESFVEKLKGVLFQAKLGSVYEKTLRIQKLAEFLCDSLNFDETIKKYSVRAGFLCKADLVTHVVGEFPKLQGIMGRVYTSENESQEVSKAIEEHYRPLYSGGLLPETICGSILSIADKIDSICGCFHVGLIPSGASDPYALRRQSIGIIQIALDNGFEFSLKKLILASLEMFKEKSDISILETSDKVYDFLVSRMTSLLIDEGFSRDLISAVTSASAENIPSVWKRLKSLAKLKSEPYFENIAISFKRIVNIIKKSDQAVRGNTVVVDEVLFEKECEKELFELFKEVKDKVLEDINASNFDGAFYNVASLREKVDKFFDGVLVMADNEKIRNNRFSLLLNLSNLFELLADFSKIST
ncbi:MAG: glycine--tRNA ligase subunit beta [Desulfobacterales bacterium]|nr:glycine--tRNA ligase subunit beta [Desulfobacterales bacterium]